MSRPGRLRALPWAVLRLGRAGGGRAAGVVWVWRTWERLMLGLYRLRPARPDGILLFRVRRHRGPDHLLADGTVVVRGQLVVELHLANRRLVAMQSGPGYSPFRVLHVMRLDLAELGRRAQAGELGPVRALHGLSLMGAAGPRLGFEVVEPRPTRRLAFERYFMVGIDAVYHPSGLGRLEGRARERRPVEVWLPLAAAAALAPRRAP